MHCLNDCENAVLDFFMGKGDRTTCLYQCAEELAEKWKNPEVIAACEVLLSLGLVKNCGDTTVYLKLSPSAMGDVATGYFREAGHKSKNVVALEKRLLELELKAELQLEEAAVRAAARPPGTGGLVDPGKKKKQ